MPNTKNRILGMNQTPLTRKKPIMPTEPSGIATADLNFLHANHLAHLLATGAPIETIIELTIPTTLETNLKTPLMPLVK
jgi:hypothetical protein